MGKVEGFGGFLKPGGGGSFVLLRFLVRGFCLLVFMGGGFLFFCG